MGTTLYSLYVIGNEIYKYNKEHSVNSEKTVDDLTEDAKHENKTGNGTEVYNKEGGLQQAEKDFNDIVVPGSARPIANGKVGKTADGKTVNVRNESSDGRPTLEVYNPNTRQSEIKIRYK